MDFLPAGIEEAGMSGNPGTPGNPNDHNDGSGPLATSTTTSIQSAAKFSMRLHPRHRDRSGLGDKPGCEGLRPEEGLVRGSFGLWVDVELALFEVDLRSCRCCFHWRFRRVRVEQSFIHNCPGGCRCRLRRQGPLRGPTSWPARTAGMRPATAHPVAADELAMGGAVIVDSPVVVSERIVTAAGPFAAREFAERIVAMARLGR